jgi:hypothetical protein
MEALVSQPMQHSLTAEDTKYDRTPLSWAARNGHEAVVRLLKEGADLDTVDAAGVTALEHGAFNYYDAVELLLLDSRASIPPDFYGLQQLFSEELE